MNTDQFDIWKMLVGVAFFLLAMDFMESALGLLAGRKFKLFLKKQTDNKFKAIGGSAIVTGILQSSSIVNLMVLSMVGVGVVKLENALALVLGSNLGTTLDSWFVAVFGFNYDIETLVLPVAAITGIGMFFFKKDSLWFLWFKFLFSIAFIFIALGFIKSGMEAVVLKTDLSSFAHYPIIVFLILGFVLTAIIQSSSATVVITLSALHTNAIALYMATAIVLGSEIGTTLKLFLASIGADSPKKRVALGNFLFNFITVMVVFLLLKPINNLIENIVHIKDHLIALVLFQTLLNMISILIFVPFLPLVSRFLKSRYIGNEESSTYISKVSIKPDIGIAINALEKETRQLLQYILQYSLDSFDINEKAIMEDKIESFRKKTLLEKYDFIKQLHGEMHLFYLNLQIEISDKADAVLIENLLVSFSNALYSAKNIRDSQNDILSLKNSSNDLKYQFYQNERNNLIAFYRLTEKIFENSDRQFSLEMIDIAKKNISDNYTANIQFLYQQSNLKMINDLEITTLINFNREFHTALDSLLFAIKSLYKIDNELV